MSDKTARGFFDKTDIVLLNILQDDFPLVPEPWRIISSETGVPEDEILNRTQRLINLGIIRGITPVLNSCRFGLTEGTLVAVHVSPEEQDNIVRVINSYDEVSHNYLREHYYSVWFTLKSYSRERIEEILDEILEKTNIRNDDILELPTVASYKTDVRFRCGDENNQKHRIFLPGSRETECIFKGV